MTLTQAPDPKAREGAKSSHSAVPSLSSQRPRQGCAEKFASALACEGEPEVWHVAALRRGSSDMQTERLPGPHRRKSN
jgi:hypothetical protein